MNVLMGVLGVMGFFCGVFFSWFYLWVAAEIFIKVYFKYKLAYLQQMGSMAIKDLDVPGFAGKLN